MWGEMFHHIGFLLPATGAPEEGDVSLRQVCDAIRQPEIVVRKAWGPLHDGWLGPGDGMCTMRVIARMGRCMAIP